MAKHTPGPWIYGTGPDWKGAYWIAHSQAGNAHAVLTADSNDPESHEANARLIAAAPALLAALEDIYNEAEYSPLGWQVRVHALAGRAIAKVCEETNEVIRYTTPGGGNAF